MTIQDKIDALAKEQKQLELDEYKSRLDKKFEELKKKIGTVDVNIMKTGKKTRYVLIQHHVNYTIEKDNWNTGKKEQYYIKPNVKSIKILHSLLPVYSQYEIECKHGDNYDKIGADDNNSGYSYATLKQITVDEFKAIWLLCKLSTHNILDGLLDITNIEWVMNGTDGEHEFNKEDLFTKNGRKNLDLPHFVLSGDESVYLNNKFCTLFLHRNLYLITENSLEALDKWLDHERKWDNFYYNACASVGERWRGSRLDKYINLVEKIKKAS